MPYTIDWGLLELYVTSYRRNNMRKKVKKWYDGDSGVFSDGTKFRLNNVGAPEKHQFGGKKAAKTVSGMTSRSNGIINWIKTGIGHYGRELGKMSNKDGSINSRMRKKGYKNKGR